MDYTKSSLLNYMSSIPYRIHPTLHFLSYKSLLFLGLKNVIQDCVVRFMVANTKEGDCVFDIGANMGTYTYSLSKAVGIKGRVCSFEANPVTVVQLKRNISSKNVQIENLAVSNVSGEKTFYMHTKGCGPTSSLEYHEALDQDNEIKPTIVRCVTVDQYCHDHQLRPDLIKIDVEGHEYDVIKGAASVIEHYRPYLVFEFIEVWWIEKNVYKIFEYLKDGYHLIRLEDGADAELAYKDYEAPRVKDFRESRVVNIGCLPRAGYTGNLGSID